MSKKLIAIRAIINEMEETFNSHDFIRRFSQKFQVEYAKLLAEYEYEPFRKVHAQIGRFFCQKIK
jgi:hypothetical protein